MALSPSDIRGRIATAIDTALAGSGWHESLYPYPLFPTGGAEDSREHLHLGYAVGIGVTDTLAERQRIANGVYVRTEINVRYAYRLRVEGAVTDYDAAMDAELSLVAAIMAVSRNPELVLELRGVSLRGVDAQGKVYVGQINLFARHLYALA